MKFIKYSNELKCRPACGGSVCGMCPFCVFAPKPAGSALSLWVVSDGHRRRFVVELLLRCTNVLLLESIQNMLCATSWTLFTYARSRAPVQRQDCDTRRGQQEDAPDLDMEKIWDWFSKNPDWIKSFYLCRLFLLSDSELLRIFANLTNVLLARIKSGSSSAIGQRGGREDPALTVVPGSSESLSGVNKYRDFISGLSVYLSKRILGLLDEHTLKYCQKVCRRWQHIAKETIEEKKFRKSFQVHLKSMGKVSKGINASPTYANFVDVLVPANEDEEPDVGSSNQKVIAHRTAYGKIKTKVIRMEERNVYCGAYYPKVLVNKEDPYRVVDYRGQSFMVTASKDCAVHLFHVASEAKAVSEMKGHVGSIRAVLLCEDRDLIITASCDATIRCWNLKTDLCEIVLYGHTGNVNCLDINGDTLVSGAKDCTLRAWNLLTRKRCDGFNFKHPSSIQCVKLTASKLYSSCDRGLIKIWNMETPSLLRVIDGHKSSVKCLFFNEWYLLSGDSSGQVMVWSTHCHVKDCLMTYNHPKEVKTLALIYLRVVTGCVDGKIRIFNFLTGDCLRVITIDDKTGRILSLHFLENGILVNTICGVRLYKFAKIFWDYSESSEGGQSNMKPAAHLKKVFYKDQTEGTPSFDIKKTDISPSGSQVRDMCQTAPLLLGKEVKATSEELNKRVLQGSTSQKSWDTEELSNTNSTAQMQDWDPHRPPDSPNSSSQVQEPTPTNPVQQAYSGQTKKSRTVLERRASQNLIKTAVTNAADTKKRHHQGVVSKKAQLPSADTQGVKSKAGADTAGAKKTAKTS